MSNSFENKLKANIVNNKKQRLDKNAESSDEPYFRQPTPKVFSYFKNLSNEKLGSRSCQFNSNGQNLSRTHRTNTEMKENLFKNSTDKIKNDAPSSKINSFFPSLTPPKKAILKIVAWKMIKQITFLFKAFLIFRIKCQRILIFNKVW